MSRQSLPSLFSEDSNAPFFRSMQKEMNQIFDRFRGVQPGTAEDMFGQFGRPMFPAIDVVDGDDAVEVTAEVPGVDEKNLDVSISDGVLVLKGEKSSDHEEKEKDYQLIERRYGSFRRQIPLGFMPEEGAVDAAFKDGVLKLKIAKPAETKATTQKISIGKK